MADEVQVLPGSDDVEVRFLGAYSLESYKRRMTAAGQACKDRSLRFLLVDIRELQDFNPSTTDRYELGNFGAKANRHQIRVAMLITPDQARDTFGVTVAQNLGVSIQVFTERDKAVDRLLAPKGGKSRPSEA